MDREVDLTLEAVFGGDHYPHLLFPGPRDYRQQFEIKDQYVEHFGTNREGTFRIVVSDFGPDLVSSIVSPIRDEDEMAAEAHREILGKYPAWYRHAHPSIFEDYWSDCQRCGVELNALTRSTCEGLCRDCNHVLDGDGSNLYKLSLLG